MYRLATPENPWFQPSWLTVYYIFLCWRKLYFASFMVQVWENYNVEWYLCLLLKLVEFLIRYNLLVCFYVFKDNYPKK